MGLFSEIVIDIERAYSESENELGWRFLNGSKSTLVNNNKIALITLNPGGRVENPKHGIACCENGHSYLSEIWGKSTSPGDSILQKQFQALFKKCAKYSPHLVYPSSLTEAVTGYFIPFRSPSYKTLKDKKESLVISKKIWDKILREMNASIIFCIDLKTFKSLKAILAGIYGNPQKTKVYSTGWGDYKAEHIRYSTCSLVRFPHLSRFSIFGRVESEAYLDKMFEEVFSEVSGS